MSPAQTISHEPTSPPRQVVADLLHSQPIPRAYPQITAIIDRAPARVPPQEIPTLALLIDSQSVGGSSTRYHRMIAKPPEELCPLHDRHAAHAEVVDEAV
jgi:hypothetical protein